MDHPRGYHRLVAPHTNSDRCWRRRVLRQIILKKGITVRNLKLTVVTIVFTLVCLLVGAVVWDMVYHVYLQEELHVPQ